MADFRPAIPVAVDQHGDRVAVDLTTGERRPDYELVFTEYDAGRMRDGYVCINCWEAQVKDGLPVAFPERCQVPHCGFPMREKQAERFAREFEGYAAPLGPSKSLAELRAEDEEAKERARRILEGKPTSRILVPR